MATVRRVLIVGLIPELIDFSSAAFAFVPGMSAEKVRAGLDQAQAELDRLGYQAQQCLIDFGETAEAVLRQRLEQQSFDAVLVGAGVRVPAENFLLFEKVLNVIHRYAPKALICFNQRPDDTVASVRRWL